MTLVPEAGQPDGSLLLIKTYLDSALADNTRRAYRSDLEQFKSWGGIIPASPEMIAAYLSTNAETLSIATLQRRLVAISKVHTMQGYADSTKADLVRMPYSPLG